MVRLRGGRRRWVIAGVLVAVLVVAAIVAWPYVQLYMGAAPPAQFYQEVELEPALAHDYPRVLGVAHNAGNNLGTLTRALLYLHSRLPEVTMLFSVAGPDAVHQLLSTPALQGAIGGVSVFQGLVDANLVAWVHQHGLLILAWTVNDSQRLNQLVRLGVDGITTANLAILQALG